MTNDQKIINNKLGLLKLAKTLGNVTDDHLLIFGPMGYFSPGSGFYYTLSSLRGGTPSSSLAISSQFFNLEHDQEHLELDPNMHDNMFSSANILEVPFSI